ncbi:MAG: class 1 fructose-bisphosphatase [Nitrospinales bacterium]
MREEEENNPGATGAFTSLMNEVLVAAKIVSREVNQAGIGEDILGLTGDINIQGEEVQKLDLYANDIFIKILKRSGLVCAITSEEAEEAIIFPPEESPGKYIFMMDPLDGSSNIDVNVSIGTIFSIYRKKSKGTQVTEEDLFQKGKDQVAGGYIIYGSSTMFVYSNGRGVHGFTLDPYLGEFFLSRPDIKIPSKGSMYSINEGTWELWSDQQKKLVQYLKSPGNSTRRPYNQRYIGSLVSDFHRTQGKLRLAFEAAPLAYIVENAGGLASTGKQRILDITPDSIHQRVPLIIGSREDVELAEKFLSES